MPIGPVNASKQNRETPVSSQQKLFVPSASGKAPPPTSVAKDGTRFNIRRNFGNPFRNLFRRAPAQLPPAHIAGYVLPPALPNYGQMQNSQFAAYLGDLPPPSGGLGYRPTPTAGAPALLQQLNNQAATDVRVGGRVPV